MAAGRLSPNLSRATVCAVCNAVCRSLSYTHRSEVVMEDAQIFSVEELEARFEMESLVAGSNDLLPDWTCECKISSK